MDKTEERLMEDHTVTLNEVDIHWLKTPGLS